MHNTVQQLSRHARSQAHTHARHPLTWVRRRGSVCTARRTARAAAGTEALNGRLHSARPHLHRHSVLLPPLLLLLLLLLPLLAPLPPLLPMLLAGPTLRRLAALLTVGLWKAVEEHPPAAAACSPLLVLALLLCWLLMLLAIPLLLRRRRL